MVKLDEMVRVTSTNGRSWIVRERYFDKADYEEGETFEFAPDATGLELAQLIDEELESANYHSLCGLASDIHGIVMEASNKEIADKVLETMWNNGTLQNLY